MKVSCRAFAVCDKGSAVSRATSLFFFWSECCPELQSVAVVLWQLGDKHGAEEQNFKVVPGEQLTPSSQQGDITGVWACRKVPPCLVVRSPEVGGVNAEFIMWLWTRVPFLWPESCLLSQAQVMLPSWLHNLLVKHDPISEAGKFVDWLKDFVCRKCFSSRPRLESLLI